MQTISYSEARAQFAAMLDRVNQDRAPLLITRQGGKPAVLISLEDYESLDETAYLMRNPANARALRAALTRLDRGQGVSLDADQLDPGVAARKATPPKAAAKKTVARRKAKA
jgi:antitoxin YefM